jgi:hypothetical protein
MKHTNVRAQWRHHIGLSVCTLCVRIYYTCRTTKQSINMLQREKQSTSFDVIMSHDKLVPASTGARVLYRERGVVLFFLYKVSLKNQSYTMTDRFTNILFTSYWKFQNKFQPVKAPKCRNLASTLKCNS